MTTTATRFTANLDAPKAARDSMHTRVIAEGIGIFRESQRTDRQVFAIANGGGASGASYFAPSSFC